MKKFIVFCLMLIVTVSLGVTVWYFVRDNEELVINMEPYVYINKSDNLEVDAFLKNAKVGNELIITSLNPDVLEEITWTPNPDIKAFEAKKGGAAILEIKVKKGSIAPVYIEVAVGDGTKETPYFIDSEAKLLSIGNDAFKANDNYILMQDISLTQPIKPILNDSEFSGTFNGNGYSIKDLRIETNEGVSNAGLFAKISETGVVTGLTLSNVNIDGQFETAGAIAGLNNGTINRCFVTGGIVRSTYQTTDAGSTVGGVCGTVKYSNANVGRVDRCFSNVSVYGTENVGGLVGFNNGAIIINSYVSLEDSNVIKTMKGNSNVGGLVGLVSNLESKTAIVKNCYSLGKVVVADGVSSSSVKLGSIIGYNKEISINSSNLLMGLYTDSSSVVMINHEFNRSFDENQEAEKINYRGLNAFEKDSDNKVVVSKLISYVAKKLENKTDKVLWDFTNVWVLDATTGYPVLNKNGASVPDDVNFIYKPESIANWNDLLNFASAVKNGTALPYYILTSDITISGEFTPIGAVKAFDGIFEGNGKTIKNLNI
ncbi:MAG: GLUG motif-containing protein, partial [Christensenellales bacterium]